MKPIVYIIIAIIVVLLIFNFKCNDTFADTGSNNMMKTIRNIMKLPKHKYQEICPEYGNLISNPKTDVGLTSKNSCIYKAKHNNHNYALLFNYNKKDEKGYCITAKNPPNSTPRYNCYIKKCTQRKIINPDGTEYQSIKQDCNTETIDKTTHVYKLD